jgi:ATP-dependent DNA helicase PIF1
MSLFSKLKGLFGHKTTPDHQVQRELRDLGGSLSSRQNEYPFDEEAVGPHPQVLRPVPENVPKTEAPNPENSLEVHSFSYPGLEDALALPGPLFITGQAGTGKSTLVRHLVKVYEHQKKRVAVVAPTGIAAMNSKGETIHSFFNFPPIFMDYRNFHFTRPDILSVLDVLIIDEISMVRADMLDCINASLQNASMSNDEPRLFAGIKVIMVGDLFQLPPVVTKDQAFLFSDQGPWSSPFFFDAHCLKDVRISCIELTKVHRLVEGSDRESFLNLLGKIRVGEADKDVMDSLRLAAGRVQTNPVVLTGLKKVAAEMNEQRLASIDADPIQYDGVIEGTIDFKESNFPSPMKLLLKPGAQVLFTKNIPEKGVVNGMMGVVDELGHDSIAVKVRTESGFEVLVLVKRVGWEQFKHTYDKEQKRIVAEKVGTFFQFPLILGWAMTIHKSQGLTLPSVSLKLGRSFASGQVYVAVSRVRRVEDLHLASPLRSEDVFTDGRIKRFMNSRIELKSKIE